MILRKPYAFIIKHFRLIHLLLLACIVFLVLSNNDVYQLFSNLQKSNTFFYAGANNYVDNTVYLFILVGISLSGVVFWLLREKKKPTILYLGLIIYFVLEIIANSYFHGIINALQDQTITIDTIVFVKDISSIIIYPGYAFIVLCFIRGIGFNIKQFNFSKDIEELQIAEKDSAEFEFIIGQNNYKYMRTFRRTLREVKYYIIENKFAFTCIIVVILAIGSCFGIYYYNEYEKKLSESAVASVNGITYSVNKAYVTAKDINGKEIKKGSKYVIVNMNFFNSTYESKKLDLKLISLTDGRLSYKPTLTKNSKFYDLGVPYKEDELIKSNDVLNATLIFEIPSSVLTKNFTLQVQYGLENALDRVISRYRKFEVKTTNIDTKETTKNNSFNETISINTVGENRFSITVTNYEIRDSYDNRFIVCTKELTCMPISRVVSPNNIYKDTMVIIDYNGTMYDDANFTKTFNTYNKVFMNYAELTYTIANKEYKEKVNIVPMSEVEGKAFINVDRRIRNASRISLSFHFRNETFNIPLKQL